MTAEIMVHGTVPNLYGIIIENTGGPPVSKVTIEVFGATITQFTDMADWNEIQIGDVEISWTVESKQNMIIPGKNWWEAFGVYFSDNDFSIDWTAYNHKGKVLGSGTVSYP